MEIYESRHFLINKTLLTFIGLWPFDVYKKKIIRRIFFSFIITFMAIPHIIGIFKHFRDDIDRLLEHIAVLMYVIEICLKFFTSMWAEKNLKATYESIAKNWLMISDKNEKNILIEYSERGRMLTISYISYITAALTIFVTLPLTPVILNTIKPSNESRPYIFILDGEFIIDRNENYGKVYVFDLVTCSVSSYIFVAVDTMYTVCIEHCVGLFAIVKYRLKVPNKLFYNEYSSDLKKEDPSYEWVIKTIQLHQIILKFTDVLEKSYSSSFLMVMSINLVYFSILSVLLLINLDRPLNLIRYVMLLLGLTMHLFYLSWPGQKIIDHSSDLFRVAYLNEWYEGSKKSKKLLKIFILRCSEPCLLTAGGLYIMNFENFLSVMKKSISYITVFSSFR